MSKKIYCKNCEYYYCVVTSWTSTRRWKERYCDPHHLVIRGFFNDEYDLDKLEKCDSLNSGNNCVCYKRKWWKFWLKED